MFRSCRSIIFLLFYFFLFPNLLLSQARVFSWIDPNTAYRNKIDIDTEELISERSPGVWVKVGKVKFDPAINLDIPPSFKTNYFILNGGKKIRFTLVGTGQVYEFEPKNRIFQRIDRTFYRGYNFDAVQFIRKGKLHSFGGYGFWHYSNTLTYYDEKRGEWEVIRTKNIGPKSIGNNMYSAYSEQLDVFYAGSNEVVEPLEKIDSKISGDFYVFDFSKNTWSLLGKINPILMESKQEDLYWNGKYFFKWQQDKLFIINPERNEVFLYSNHEKFFTTNGQYLAKGDTIYNYWNDQGNIDFFSIKEVMSKAKYFGPFYEKETPFLTYLLIFSLIFSSGGVAWIYLINKKKTDPGYFEPLEEKLLRALLKKGQKGSLTSQQVNDTLLLHTKSFDNQRRIRVNVIKQINQKMSDLFKVSNAIVRMSSIEDKRQSVYKLSPEAFERLKEYFN